MKLWIVGKLTEWPAWELVGVFDSEAAAVAACLGPSYFVGPATLNEPTGPETQDWPEAYHPHLKEIK